MTAVEEASKNLWAYVNGLESDQRAKAIAYLLQLELESGGTTEGMLKTILLRLDLHALYVAECAAIFNEVCAEAIATDLIQRARHG